MSNDYAEQFGRDRATEGERNLVVLCMPEVFDEQVALARNEWGWPVQEDVTPDGYRRAYAELPDGVFQLIAVPEDVGRRVSLGAKQKDLGVEGKKIRASTKKHHRLRKMFR